MFIMKIYSIMFISKNNSTFFYITCGFSSWNNCLSAPRKRRVQILHHFHRLWDAIFSCWIPLILQDFLDSSDEFFSLDLSTFAQWYFGQGVDLDNISNGNTFISCCAAHYQRYEALLCWKICPSSKSGIRLSFSN